MFVADIQEVHLAVRFLHRNVALRCRHVEAQCKTNPKSCLQGYEEVDLVLLDLGDVLRVFHEGETLVLPDMQEDLMLVR